MRAENTGNANNATLRGLGRGNRLAAVDQARELRIATNTHTHTHARGGGSGGGWKQTEGKGIFVCVLRDSLGHHL